MELSEKISKYFEEMLAGTLVFASDITHDIEAVISDIDAGKKRIVSFENGKYIVNEYIKKAILLYMKSKNSDMTSIDFTNMGSLSWFDKIPLKTSSWTVHSFQEANFRAVPGSVIRYGSHIEKNVIIMPSFINIGAFVGEGTMIDTWSTVGSCAQIGKNCHISGGAGIGGVLEPIQASPVIIEDNCFIGARSEIAEGVIVERGSVISMGVFIGASTKIINRQTGEIIYGRVPANSVVVPGTIQDKNGIGLYAAVIVKTVDDKTRSKTSINELLRH